MASIVPILIGLLGAPGILQGLMSMFPPFGSINARRGFSENPSLLPTIEQIINLRIRGHITHDVYLNEMAEAGLTADRATNLLSGSESLLTAYDYITLWRRKELTEEEVDEKLSHIGYQPDSIAQVKRASLYFPNPQDIVRFAVREVFTPAAREKYGLAEDLPPEYLEQSQKAGLSDDMARFFWMSHWVLPSANQVYAMFHREIVTEDELQQYLKAADYMPWWREKLTALSYNPLTRVDVRRMHAMGVLNDEQVNKAYRDIGYSPENSALMTEFTLLYNERVESSTPRATIVAAYRKGVYDRDKALAELLAIRIDETTANLYLDLEDQKIAEEELDLKADSIVDGFKAGKYDEAEMRVLLTEAGVPHRQLTLTIARELAQWEKRHKSATKTDLDRWFKYGLINQETYISRLITMGYDEDTAILYFDETLIEYLHTDRADLPYVDALRRYVENKITITALKAELESIGYDEKSVRAITEIADQIITSV